MPVLLWTDGLFLLVLTGLALSGLALRRQEHFARPWRSVLASHTASISAVILTGFLFIGVADSIHYQPLEGDTASRGEIVSLLDHWLDIPRTHTEKTYSEPLAAHAFTRESMTDAEGHTVWSYPRLRHGGHHLQDPATERWPDIGRWAGRGLLKATLLMGGIIGVWHLWCWRAGCKIPGIEQPALRSAGLTLVFLCLLAGVVGELADHYHVLGTDKVGEDVLYQSLKSVRTGLLLGTLTTLATLPLALGFGVLAGYFRGWVDDIIQYLYTTLNAIPGVLLIAATMLIMQAWMGRYEAGFASLTVRADFRLLALCLILGLTNWTGLCRLLRAETLKLREMDYVLAARALGVRTPRILLRHILPNLFHLVLISLALDFSALVLAEAVLSYVNIGVDPATYSWGNMINSARLEMAREPVVWWSLASAFVFMFSLVLAANLFADAVRDAFDPRRN
ncbi:ABC transporter permease [Candidatus Woesearchaeota archaeon]|jgi:peptide/nickel transport system permease protein|nr:ABC transporter permease [Candidatus Woesearchaeota archaeon]